MAIDVHIKTSVSAYKFVEPAGVGQGFGVRFMLIQQILGNSFVKKRILSTLEYNYFLLIIIF